MAYTYEQVFAADPANPSNIAQNAAITIFAPGDSSMTPLAITDPDGQPLANPIPVNANGFGSAFAHATLDRVAWAGGGFTGYFTSYEGMKGEAVAARQAAETASSNAAAAAQAELESRIAAGEFHGADGQPGAPGQNGSNVLPTDTAIAAAVDNTASATRASLNAAAAAKIATDAPPLIGASKATRVFRLAVLGNSWDDGTSTNDTNAYATAPATILTDSTWFNLAIAMSGGKIVNGGNYGIGGQNTAQVVARVPDVIAANPRPTACVIGELTNTIGGVTSDATVMAAVDELFAGADQLAAAGIIPIIRNCPARGTTGTPKTDSERKQVALANVKIARLAARKGYPLVDVHRATVDPLSGKLLDASSTDGVHINKVYTRKTAEAVLDVVLPMAGGYAPFLAGWNADPTNMIPNGLFLGTTTTVGGYPMPDGWGGGSATMRAITAPVAADKLIGNWFDVSFDAALGAANTATSVSLTLPGTTSILPGTSTFEVGDVLRFACRARIEDIENGVVATNSTHYAGITVLLGGLNVNYSPMYQWQSNVGGETLVTIEFTVPAGTTSLRPQLTVAGQGKLRVGQMTLRNITKLGAL